MTIIEHERVEVRETVVELDPRVRRGAAFLDEWEDGWAQKIDLETLQLANGYDCVLGQARGAHFVSALAAYGIPDDSFPDWCRSHAFLGGEALEDWEDLERDWVTLIQERQAEPA